MADDLLPHSDRLDLTSMATVGPAVAVPPPSRRLTGRFASITLAAMRSKTNARLVAAGWVGAAAMIGIALLLPSDDVELRHRAGTAFGLTTLVALVVAVLTAQRAAHAPTLHPRRLAVGPGRLEAATCVSLAAITAVQPVLFALLVIANLPRLREPAPPGISAGWIFVVLVALPIAICAYLTVPFTVRELTGEPGLSINAAGVRMRVKVNQWREIPWGAMDREDPVILRGSVLTLRADRPDQVRSGGLFLGRRRRYTAISVRHRLAVDPEFLASAIAFYARHPDERAGIGSGPGYPRLVSGTADPPPDPASAGG